MTSNVHAFCPSDFTRIVKKSTFHYSEQLVFHLSMREITHALDRFFRCDWGNVDRTIAQNNNRLIRRGDGAIGHYPSSFKRQQIIIFYDASRNETHMGLESDWKRQ